ncbi:MAG: cupin domain-containing protein [Myxococcota bacterium]
MTRESIPTWSALLGPRTLAEFVEQDWERRVVLSRGDAARLGPLRQVAKWRESQWLTEVDAATRDASGVQSQSRVPIELAADHYARGATICGDVSSDPGLAPLLAAMGAELGLAGRPFAKLYASPPQAGFAPHFDAHHVFVLQLSGRKRWWFSDGPALHRPAHSGKAHAGEAVWAAPMEGPVTDDEGQRLEVPEVDALRCEVLQPGDCLYLPPGTWHTTAAERHSVAISVSPANVQSAHWVLSALAEQLAQRAACRGIAVAGGPGAVDGRVAPRVASEVDACLEAVRAAIDSLDPRDVHRAWLGGQQVEMPPAPDVAPAGPLSPDTKLRTVAPEGLPYLIAPAGTGGADVVHLYGAGAEWTLPLSTRGFLDAIARQEAFTVEQAADFDPAVAGPDAEGLLRQLLRAGLVARLR